jgi:hypothetical protein
MPRFERVESPEDTQDRLLDEVFSLVLAPGVLRQATMSPATQRRDASLNQHIDGRSVALMRARQQLESRLDVLRISVIRTPLLVAHFGPRYLL